MPVTSLDPSTALIVVDLQAGLTGLPTVHPFGDIVANTAALADAFRARYPHCSTAALACPDAEVAEPLLTSSGCRRVW